MIERIRINAQGRSQLVQIKRKTGIDQYNVICRYALVLSLAEKSIPPTENGTLGNGIEIDWRTFCGGETILYEDMIAHRCKEEGKKINEENARECLTIHVHRGLAYLNANPDKIFD